MLYSFPSINESHSKINQKDACFQCIPNSCDLPHKREMDLGKGKNDKEKEK